MPAADKRSTGGDEAQQLERKLPFPEALGDDWAGISNPKERRKIQNRLAQRAYRQRNSQKGNLKIRFFHPDNEKHTRETPKKKERSFLNHLVEAVTDALPRVDNPNETSIIETAVVEFASRKYDPENEASAEDSKMDIAVPSGTRVKEELWAGHQCQLNFETKMYADHLFIDLIYYNVYRAFEVNTGSLGLTIYLLTQDILSPFNTIALGGNITETPEEGLKIVPLPDPTPNLPPSLRPTSLQFTIFHHPYVDLFPSPRVRDNLLCADGSFCPDELCVDIMGSCKGRGTGIAGLIVWGDPWDPSGWEVAEHFVQKYRWMFEGCDDVIQGTNYWRALRGLENLNLGV